MQGKKLIYGAAVWFFMPFYVEVWVPIWKTFSLNSKIPFLCFVMAENSVFGKSSTYCGLFFSFQLPFDDEHIPTLFKKIKGWQFYSLFLFSPGKGCM